MATFYRGAGVDTYWHKRDARQTGFQPWDPGAGWSIDRLLRHIIHGTTYSPFVSLTASFGIACDYATHAGLRWPSRADPAYVYEIELYETSGVTCCEPIREIVHHAPKVFSGNSYHHDGQSTFLLGVISPSLMQQFLSKAVIQPPPGGGTSRPANLSHWLEAMVRALRDSEILTFGAIPRHCITNRFEVY